MKYVLEITPQRCGDVFNEHGQVTVDTSILKRHPERVSLIVFTGGSDVWPELYGENPIWETHYNSARDIYEGEMFELADKHGIPKVGICRGAQFLCVKSGGKLIQDIGGHEGGHKLRTNDDRVIPCNSSHHQMQLPSKNAVPLAWCDGRRSDRYLNGDRENVDVDHEYEVVYYPNINAVGVQYHPEWMLGDHPCVLYAQEVVRKYLFGAEE